MTTCGIVRLKVLNLPTKASKIRPCKEGQDKLLPEYWFQESIKQSLKGGPRF